MSQRPVMAVPLPCAILYQCRGWQQMPNAGHWFSQRPSPKHSALRAGKNCAEISFGCISNICSPLIAHVIMIIFRLQRAHKHWVIAMPIVRRQNHGSIAPFLKTHWWPHDRSSAKAKKLLKQGVIAALHALVSPKHYIGATCYACTARGWLNFARRYFTVR